MPHTAPNTDGPPPIGIIGGTGVYDASQVSDVRSVEVSTPYGAPSAPIELGDFQGMSIAFLPRHGKGHTLPPHAINYRANLWALHHLGVRRIVSPSAVGSLKEEYKPGDFVFPDQFIDQTKTRAYTFFDEGKTVHVSLADPFCPTLRNHFAGHARELALPVHDTGTYVCIEGPRFSTRAESRMLSQFAEIIGMTACPEVQLAREMEMCYVSIAMVTDYDVWAEKPVDVPEILQTLAENEARSQSLLATAVPTIPAKRTCICANALEGAEVAPRDTPRREDGRDETFRCRLVTWDEIATWSFAVGAKIKESDFDPDVIIGLTRGGWVAARLLCDLLDVKQLYAVKVEHWGVTATPDGKARLVQGLTTDISDRRVLIVDDITDTGESLELARRHVAAAGPREARSATVLHITHSKFTPDFYEVEVPKEEWAWFIFPWNLHEDLRAIIPKALDGTARPVVDIGDALKSDFELDLEPDLIEGTLLELTEDGTAIRKGNGYRLATWRERVWG